MRDSCGCCIGGFSKYIRYFPQKKVYGKVRKAIRNLLDIKNQKEEIGFRISQHYGDPIASSGSKKAYEYSAETNSDIIDELIENHHKQVLFHSKIQFWVSIVAAIVGFIFVICVFVFSKYSEWYELVIRTLPGVIIETISVLFISQSKESNRRSTKFLNKLREDKKSEKGIYLVESINDGILKAQTKAKIAMKLCQINDTELESNSKTENNSNT